MYENLYFWGHSKNFAIADADKGFGEFTAYFTLLDEETFPN
jgi:hypothetical protein